MNGKRYIIYLTTNLENGMVYKGVHFNKKIDPYEFDGYLGSGVDLLKAIKEFGRSNFKRETLFVFDTKEEAIVKEEEEIPIEFVNDFNTYNKIVGGGGWPVMAGENHPLYGTHNTEEQKKKQSERMSGKNHYNYGKHLPEETREKISKSHKGVPLSKEHCNQLSIARKKHFKSSKGDCTRKRMSEVQRGKSLSEEHCKHISESHKGERNHMYGKQHTKETKEKMSKAKSKENHPNWGKHRSEETKKKISNALTGHTCSKKTREKISNALTDKGVGRNNSNCLSLDIITQRRLDIKNKVKTWGWKSELSRYWGVSPPGAGYFIKKYASDLVKF